MKLTTSISYKLNRLPIVEIRDAYYRVVSETGYNEIVAQFYSPLFTRLRRQLFMPILIELEIYEK